MATPELVHHATGTRTKSSDYRSVPPQRKTEDDSAKPTWREQLRRASIIVAMLVVVALTAWSALTYYNARRNSPSSVLAHTVERIYTIGYQKRASATLEKKKKTGNYTVDHMLVEANPFGTNTTSLYVFFVTDQLMSVSYTVSAPETNFPDFTRVVTTQAQRGRTHEFQVTGLIPSTKNVVTFTLTDVDEHTITRQYTYTMGDVLGNEPVRVNATFFADNSTKLTNGLYAVMPEAAEGSSTHFAFLYDSSGILRGEIPLKNVKGTRFITIGQQTCYAVSTTQFACVDKLGAVKNFFNFDERYSLFSDYTTDSNGNIIAIATNGNAFDKTKEVGTYVVRINILNGKMTVLANLARLLNSYRTTTVARALTADGGSSDGAWNWLDLDSISALDNNRYLLSSRETSSVITLDVNDSPSITSIIGSANLWNDPKYSYLLMKKNGNFADFAGQNDIRVSNVNATGYTLTLFNNNYAYSPSNPTFNWSNALPTASQRIQATNSEARSYVYTYAVNTQDNTYTLTSSMSTPYSPLYGNAQFVDDAVVTVDSQAATWSAWNNQGTQLVKFNGHEGTNVNGARASLGTVYKVQYCF